MNELLFKVFITALSLVLLILVIIIIAEVIAHRKDANRFRPRIKYLRSYKDGYAFSDNADLSQAMQVMYITSEFIEFSDTGIDGKYERIWTW